MAGAVDTRPVTPNSLDSRDLSPVMKYLDRVGARDTILALMKGDVQTAYSAIPDGEKAVKRHAHNLLREAEKLRNSIPGGRNGRQRAETDAGVSFIELTPASLEPYSFCNLGDYDLGRIGASQDVEGLEKSIANLIPKDYRVPKERRFTSLSRMKDYIQGLEVSDSVKRYADAVMGHTFSLDGDEVNSWRINDIEPGKSRLDYILLTKQRLMQDRLNLNPDDMAAVQVIEQTLAYNISTSKYWKKHLMAGSTEEQGKRLLGLAYIMDNLDELSGARHGSLSHGVNSAIDWGVNLAKGYLGKAAAAVLPVIGK